MRDVTADKNVSYVDSDYYFGESWDFAYDLATHYQKESFKNGLYKSVMMPSDAKIDHIWLMRNERNMDQDEEIQLYTYVKV